MDITPKTFLDKLLERRYDYITEEPHVSSAFHNYDYGPYLKYLLESMQAIGPEYTKRLYITTGQILQRIRYHFNEKSINIDLRYQGAVQMNTHITLNSELEILAILRPRNKVEAFKSVEKLGTLLMGLFMGEPETFEKVDYSEKVQIHLQTRRPKTETTVLPTIWVDTGAYRESKREIDRGIAEYDFQNKTRKSYLPFRNQARLNVKDEKVNGNLKKLIRFMKNLLLDSEDPIDISDYELTCSLYNIHERKLRVSQDSLPSMLPAIALYFEKLGKTGMFRRVISPSRKELVFGNKEEKGQELIKVSEVINGFLNELGQELNNDQKSIDGLFQYE